MTDLSIAPALKLASLENIVPSQLAPQSLLPGYGLPKLSVSTMMVTYTDRVSSDAALASLWLFVSVTASDRLHSLCKAEGHGPLHRQ